MTLTPELHDSRLMRAVRREPTDTTPLWIMRQAGRYLPEYRAVRAGHGFLEFCKNPRLSAQVTLDAQRILGVDAAILFADLPTILEPMGFDLDYTPGPTIANPLREAKDLERVRELEDVGEMDFVYETVRLVRRDLPKDVPLIGFAGSPFTLASYAIEGGGSKNYVFTKSLMYRDAGAWHEFMRRLSASVARYLARQVESGCQLVQLFDSWAGCLSPADYREYVLPHTKAVIDALPPGTPVINFLTGNPALLPLLRESGGQVIGVDWRVDLKDAWATLGHDVAVQGNLDPVALFADLDTLRQKTKAVLDAAEGRPGHIFNLGHGVMPEMEPDNVRALVEMVHEMGARSR
jgi:uroporphyrinogen decarboxylase